MSSLMMFNLRDDTHHLNAIFKTGLRETNMLVAGRPRACGHRVDGPWSILYIA